MFDVDQLYRLIGNRVRQLRDTQSPRMSQDDLAQILGLKRTSITNIESGQQKLTLDSVFRLCEHFGIEAGELLPRIADVSREAETQVVIGGRSEELGLKTASLLERLRPSKEKARKPSHAAGATNRQ